MKMKRNTNFEDEYINPCIEESLLSTRCLERNLYQQNKCESYFLNYRNCKKFWAKITAMRKRNGITPHLPTPEERVKIMERMKNGENVFAGS